MKVHSFSSVITNSSETIYISLDNIKPLQELLQQFLNICIPENTPDINDLVLFERDFENPFSVAYAIKNQKDCPFSILSLQRSLNSLEGLSVEEKKFLQQCANNDYGQSDIIHPAYTIKIIPVDNNQQSIDLWPLIESLITRHSARTN